MRFEYPNKPTSNKLTPSGSSYSCLTAGFYPVGALNTWHGGIHIEGESVPLYAIADGEIIAYKISSKYLEDKILKGNEEQTAFYSDSFVLIRHKYEYDEGKVFTFYSLYNHLQIKEEITKEACPVFLSRHRTIKSAKQCLRVGANLRDANDTKKVLGVIPCGTAVDVLSKDGKMFEVETFSLWRKTSSVSNSITYELKCDKTAGKCYNRANQFDGIVFKEGIVIRKDILSKEDTFGVEGCVLYEDIGNKPMGILTKNMEVEIIEKSSEKKQWFKVKASELWIESEESTDSKIIYEKTPGEFEGWCENLNGQFDDYLEPEYDTIQSVFIPVNTENAIGYSGKYGSADGQALKNYHAAHVEVFSNDDVPAFLQAMLKKVTLDNKVYYKEKRETFFSIGKTIESYEYTKGKASEENISPYDWRAFGFRIFDGDPHGYFMSSDTPLLQEILGIVDTNLDGELSEKEFDDVRCNKAVNAHLSKMICVHRSEWTYRDDGLAKLKDEAGLVLDGCIKKANPKSSKEKQAYLDLKEEYVNRFEKKAKNLSFLYGISFPKMFSLLPDFCFYYFHPFAFVEQMRRMQSLNSLWPIDEVFNGAERLIISGFYRNDNPNKFHGGIDIQHKPKGERGIAGGNVYATHDGIIMTAKYSETAGNFVIVQKGNVRTQYMHLSSIDDNITVEKEILAGTILGKVGNTGRSFGNHLHYQIDIKNGETWTKVNPVLGDPKFINQIGGDANIIYELKNIEQLVSNNK